MTSSRQLLDKNGIISPSAITLAVIMLAFVVPSSQSAHAQTLTVLHSFSGDPDGAGPFAGVTLDSAGSLYGTTYAGGTRNQGTIYQLKHSGSTYTYNILYNFLSAGDGGLPEASVVFAPGGALYGTTIQGGYDGCSSMGHTGCGVVFSVRPQSTFCRTVFCYWLETPAYAFHGGDNGDGAFPLYGKLAFDQAGNIYGTTWFGGAYGGGTLYELSRSNGTWTETILHNFGASGDGSEPLHNVILDSAGNLYGTTQSGGVSGGGTVFQLVPSGSGWTENIIANFSLNSPLGGAPQAGLTIDQAGNLYGATGIGSGSAGTAFELSPSGSGWQMTLLHQFPGGNQYGVVGNMVLDSQGDLFGTTFGGGPYLAGTIFKLTPSGSGWTYTDLYDFTNGDDGAAPTGDSSMDAQGNLYGTCQDSGALGQGVAWKFSPQ